VEQLESIIREIRSLIEAIDADTALYEEMSFRDRVEALDLLESDVVERIEGLRLIDERSEALRGLRQYAERVRERLEEGNEGLFRGLRQDFASGNYSGVELRRRMLGYAGIGSDGGRDGEEGYDCLDALVNGLLLTEDAPEEVRQREPEMVFYQPTPARIVLEMVEKADLRPDDVFYDIGSGLGQVAILVHLLSGVRVKGVEVEPAYCDYARRCANGLNLSQVEFANVDAREADYSDGTVFFLYTPCEGRMLERVLERLEDESRKRSIRLHTYGPCTLQVSRQRWLRRVDQNGSEANRLATFRALGRGPGSTESSPAPDLARR